MPRAARGALLLLFLQAPATLGATAGVLSWLGCSDVHFGHDVIAADNSTTTALELNIAAVAEMNALPLNSSWPESLGGGVVQWPAGLVITGDLIDNGYSEAYEVDNFTAVYGLTGHDGMVHFPVYEGRGNHDGGNSTDKLEPHFVASLIVERNQVRAGLPNFNLTAISSSGLHYSWKWEVSPTCVAHFFMLNEYAGHLCDGCDPSTCFYGPPCYTGWTFPEDSLGFLEDVLPRIVGTASNAPVFVLQHYGFDGYSNSWYSARQRAELFATLQPYNTAGILVGHTHAASIYSWNGTDVLPFNTSGAIDVYNIPSTQKEDSKGFPAPSEFMAFELAVDEANVATLRVAQRVAWAWGEVAATKTFACGA